MPSQVIGRIGTAGNDTINVDNSLPYGEAGNLGTYIDGGAGDDVINSTMFAAQYDQPSTLVNAIGGGDGNDKITATNMLGDTYGASSSKIVLSGGAGNDDLEAYTTGSPATNSSLTYVDFTANTVLTGGDGDDKLVAQTDAFYQIDFGTYFDPVYSNSSDVSHILNGGSGNDTLDSLIRAGTAINTLNASLVGGTGDDVLDAQVIIGNYSQYNTYEYAGVATVNQALDGQSGNDSLTAAITINFATSQSVLHNVLSGGDGNDTLSASIHIATFASDYINPANPVEALNSLSGGNGDDVLTARITIDTVDNTNPETLQPDPNAPPPHAYSVLEGGAGNDTLTVFGGNGNILDGGAGNDVLIGGDGQDTFTGGLGADRFVFTATGSAPADPDVITDFNAAQGDRIDLTALAISAGQLVITHGSGNAYTASVDLNHDGTPDFVLSVHSAQPLVASDFLF